MKRKIFVVSVVCVIAALAGYNLYSRSIKAEEEKLQGKWISVNINADSVIFDLVDSIEVVFEKKQRFKAIATVLGGDTMSRGGDYRLVKNIFFAKVDGLSREEKAEFWFKGEYLFIRDKALSITVKFKRKPKDKKTSSGWF